VANLVHGFEGVSVCVQESILGGRRGEPTLPLGFGGVNKEREMIFFPVSQYKTRYDWGVTTSKGTGGQK